MTQPEPNWPRRAYLVSHTHWDREWYLPRDRFRVSLMGVIRRTLELLEDDPEFHHFLLDGQSVLLDDYLETHPEDRDRIARLVGSGALAIGPWYVLPDEFLVSGEALVRNLLVGHQVARCVGPPQKVGYLPDSFGHIAQMPQILKLAGIDSFVFSRGTGNELDGLGWTFLWQGPDGSEVTAVAQCDGYCAAAGLGFEVMSEALQERVIQPALAVKRVRTLFQRMRPLARGELALLSNGCDHHPPQERMGDVLAQLRRAFPRTEFIHASLQDYLSAVKHEGQAVERFRGEFLSGKRQFILPGVWSARLYLKRANSAAQSLLAGLVEPLAAYTHFAGTRPWPGALLEGAWRRLLQNHPHDSICGCSIDPVHRAMMTRFDEVMHTGDQLIRDHLRSLAPSVATRIEGDDQITLAVFNPLPERRSEVVERMVVLTASQAVDQSWELVDSEGNRAPFALVGHDRVAQFWGTDYRTEWSPERQIDSFDTGIGSLGPRATPTADGPVDRYYRLHVLAADIPPVGHVVYHLRPATVEDALGPGGSVRAGEDWAENDLIRVDLHADGTFDLYDKVANKSYPGLNHLTDEADAGDEYDFARCASESKSIGAPPGRARLLVASPWLARLEWRTSWQLPKGLASDRRKRARDTVANTIEQCLTIRHGSPLVEIDVTIDNQSGDHRMRVAFDSGLVSQTLLSDGHFHLAERPVRPTEHPDWVQPPSGTWPQQDFSSVSDGAVGLAILNHGLPEIEATGGEVGAVTLWLTLLRSVGWLSRDDFAERKFANAGPMVPTPEAQCFGNQRVRYGVLPFQGSVFDAGVARLSDAWHRPLAMVQGVADGSVPGGAGLLEVASGRTRVTAIKKHERHEALVVRLYNLTTAPVEETITTGIPIKGAWRIDLLEERLEPVSCEGNRLELALGGCEIATVELSFLTDDSRPISPDSAS